MLDTNSYGNNLPFYSIDTNEIIKLSFNSNYDCLCPNESCNYFDLLPKLNLISNLFNIPSLATDVENNLLHQVNFTYFSVHDFHSSRENSQAFFQDNSLALFHANLRSLSANYDDLISLLSDLKHNFNIIGISETRILMGEESNR